MDGYYAAIGEYLDECDREQIRRDGDKLRKHDEEIKRMFRINIDNLHIGFIDKFEDDNGLKMTFREAVVVREFAEYLKQNV